MDTKYKPNYESAVEKRDALEKELKNAGESLYLIEQQYLKHMSEFVRAQSLYDSQQQIVKNWYNDLAFTSNRLVRSQHRLN